MRCLVCKNTCQLKEKTSSLTFCSHNCQKQHYIGLKTSKFWGLITKDDPETVGLQSNEGKIFEIKVKQIIDENIITIKNMLEDGLIHGNATDLPIKIDSDNETISYFIDFINGKNYIFRILSGSKPLSLLFDIFALANYLDYKKLINYILRRNIYGLIPRVNLNNYKYKFLKNYMDEIKLLSLVYQNAKHYNYFATQTENMSYVAVRRYGRALEHVKEQTIELCVAAFTTYIYVYPDKREQEEFNIMSSFIKISKEQVYIELVKYNPNLLDFISEEEQTDIICFTAVEKNKNTLSYIKNKDQRNIIKNVI